MDYEGASGTLAAIFSHRTRYDFPVDMISLSEKRKACYLIKLTRICLIAKVIQNKVLQQRCVRLADFHCGRSSLGWWKLATSYSDRRPGEDEGNFPRHKPLKFNKMR